MGGFSLKMGREITEGRKREREEKGGKETERKRIRKKGKGN